MTTIPERIREEALTVLKQMSNCHCDSCVSTVSTALLAAEKRGREEARATIIAAHDLLRADDRYGALAHLPAGGVECEEMVEKAVDLLAAAIRSTN